MTPKPSNPRTLAGLQYASSLPAAHLETMRDGSLSLGILEGQSIHLVCSAHSNPPVMLIWSRDGKALDPSKPGSPEILELSPIRAADAGMFMCHAHNPLGSLSVSIQMLMKGESWGVGFWVYRPGDVGRHRGQCGGKV